mgnify:CR=1 FL=1
MKKPVIPQPAAVAVRAANSFKRSLKRLLKKYASLDDDVLRLISELEQNPQLGEPLSRDCFKLRFAIRSKGRGKSGGARVITLVVLADATVTLLTLYDKSEKEDLLPGELDELLASL